MTEQDYELLSQYIDDELAAETAQTMRKRLLAEPELRAKFERILSLELFELLRANVFLIASQVR